MKEWAISYTPCQSANSTTLWKAIYNMYQKPSKAYLKELNGHIQR